MTSFDHHLQAAQGYLELGLYLEVHEEIEDIEPELRTRTDVLILRVAIFQALERWELMRAVARQLTLQQPDEPDWFLALATATRRAIGVQEALAALATVALRFPTEPLIFYHLARYAAQLGHLDFARARLVEAIKLDSACREMALADPDLVALRGELNA